MKIDAKTKITGLMGYPVEHSLSPDMHNAAFAALGLNYCYIAMAVHPDALTRAVEGIRAMNFRGVNVTVPHKERVIMMLDEVDEEARFIGAVNTIVNTGGSLKGFNTDGRGFMKSLEENRIEWRGRDIFMVGTGGACRAVGYYLSQGASSLRLFDINREKAEALAGDFGKVSGAVSVEDDLSGVPDADIVINATPLGLRENDPLPVDPAMLSGRQTVIDLIYWKTPLLRAASEKGCTTLDGLGMLLWQGAIAFELWTGLGAPAPVMREALARGFEARKRG